MILSFGSRNLVAMLSIIFIKYLLLKDFIGLFFHGVSEKLWSVIVELAGYCHKYFTPASPLPNPICLCTDHAKLTYMLRFNLYSFGWWRYSGII